jgi:hypothetical protein
MIETYGILAQEEALLAQLAVVNKRKRVHEIVKQQLEQYEKLDAPEPFKKKMKVLVIENLHLLYFISSLHVHISK